MTDLDAFVEQKGREDLVNEVRRKIDALDIRYVYIQYPTVTGRIVGKGIPAQHWEHVARMGVQLVYGSVANLATDRRGRYLGYGAEASELVAIPEPETFAQLPWDKKVARVFATLFRNREEPEEPGAYLRQLDLTTGSAVAYVAFFPSVVAYFTYNRGVELVGANRAGQFMHLMPFFGSILAILLLGESFRLFHAAGAALILGGLTLASVRVR